MNKLLTQFCKNPREVGSIAPSSCKMINKMLSQVDFTKRLLIVELWAGTGCFTQKILERMTDDSFLYSFEVLEELHSLTTEKIQDSRTELINDWAENIQNYVENQSIDLIVSWLPLATLKNWLKDNILHSSYQCLKKWWTYLQFQYSLSNKKDIQKHFDRHRVFFELFNIPPAFLYRCEKH